jgi:hypothetical protein
MLCRRERISVFGRIKAAVDVLQIAFHVRDDISRDIRIELIVRYLVCIGVATQ